MNLDALAVRRRLDRAVWSAPRAFGPDGWGFTNLGGDGHIIVTCADYAGVDWVHASMSRKGRVPDYADLKLLHAAVFAGGWAYQVFAPPADHVNIHEHVLHLFGKSDGSMVLPDFTGGTGSI